MTGSRIQSQDLSHSLGLLQLGYPAELVGVRRPTTSVHKCTGAQRGCHKQLERGLPRVSSKIHCTM